MEKSKINLIRKGDFHLKVAMCTKATSCQVLSARSAAGMTKEPSDAETCLHVSISEANKSDPFRGMTCKASAARMSYSFLLLSRSSQDTKWNDRVLYLTYILRRI